jgi:hypothetical protein
MNDTIVIYRQPAITWPDGMISPEDFVAVVLHRQPFDPGRVGVDGSDRSVYVKNRTRDEAIEHFDCALPEPLAERCPYRHPDTDERCVLSAGHSGVHQI